MQRRRPWGLGLVLSLSLAAGCARGAPPGFSSGDTWVLPLVGPLENDVLLVPVVIHDQGPYLFRIDPDAPRTLLERDVAEKAGLAMGSGPRFIDESDTGRQTYIAEVRQMKIGSLTVRKKYVTLVKAGTFDTATRRVYGALGRDVIADSLAFGFDRDRGIAVLSTQEAFTAPQDATSFKYDLVSSNLDTQERPVGRRVIEPTIGGSKIALHLDFGQYVSELAGSAWSKAQLASVPQHTTLVDELGSTRSTETTGIAAKVALGGIEAFGVSFVPYADKRWENNVADGKLGLGAFRDFNVWANWDKARIYLTPRTTDTTGAHTAERIKRWGWQELAACGDADCVSFEIVEPGTLLKIKRAQGLAKAGMEAVIELSQPSQPQATAQRVVATFMPGATEATIALPTPDAPSAVVLDISPFYRVCAREAQSCVVSLP